MGKKKGRGIGGVPCAPGMSMQPEEVDADQLVAAAPSAVSPVMEVNEAFKPLQLALDIGEGAETIIDLAIPLILPYPSPDDKAQTTCEALLSHSLDESHPRLRLLLYHRLLLGSKAAAFTAEEGSVLAATAMSKLHKLFATEGEWSSSRVKRLLLLARRVVELTWGRGHSRASRKAEVWLSVLVASGVLPSDMEALCAPSGTIDTTDPSAVAVVLLLLGVLLALEDITNTLWLDFPVKEDIMASTESETGMFRSPALVLAVVLRVVLDGLAGGSDTVFPGSDADVMEVIGNFGMLIRALLVKLLAFRGDASAALRSAAPPLMRLLLQYHDPVLSCHCDQHPPPKNYLVEMGIPMTNTDTALHTPLSFSDSMLDFLQLRWIVELAPLTEEEAAAETSPATLAAAHIGALTHLLDSILVLRSRMTNLLCFLWVASTILQRRRLLELDDGASLAETWRRLVIARNLSSDPQSSECGLIKNTYPPPLLFFNADLETATQGGSLPGSLLIKATHYLYENTPRSAVLLMNHAVTLDVRSPQKVLSVRRFVSGFPVLPISSTELCKSFPAPNAPFYRSAAEVANVRNAYGEALPSLQFIVLDCRAAASYEHARLPASLFIGDDVGQQLRGVPQAGFDRVQAARYNHMPLMGTGRAILDEVNVLKLVALQLLQVQRVAPGEATDGLLEGGFPYISITSKGFTGCAPCLRSGQTLFEGSAHSDGASHESRLRTMQQPILDGGEEDRRASDPGATKDQPLQAWSEWGKQRSSALRAGTTALFGGLRSTIRDRLQNAKAGDAQPNDVHVGSSMQGGGSRSTDPAGRTPADVEHMVQARTEVGTSLPPAGSKGQNQLGSTSPVIGGPDAALAEPKTYFDFGSDDELDDADLDLITHVPAPQTPPLEPRSAPSGTETREAAVLPAAPVPSVVPEIVDECGEEASIPPAAVCQPPAGSTPPAAESLSPAADSIPPPASVERHPFDDIFGD